MRIWNFILLGAGSFLLSVLTGVLILPLLRRLKMGQTVREVGPKTHYQKSGTPTMGGFIFLLPFMVLGFIPAIKTASPILLSTLLVTLLMALLGFWDDFIKVRIDKKGLSVLRKTVPMLVISAAFVGYYCFAAPGGPLLWLPFSPTPLVILGVWRWLYAAVLFVFFYFTSNAVNLTDGEDGLLAGLNVPVLGGLMAIQFLIPALRMQGQQYLEIFLLGALLGFFIYNRNPAKVFMGDLGSLAVGSFYSCVLIWMGMPWLLLLNGVIYLVEALSVVIQVAYFKKTHGKRIFRMSPIHHHYELGGWSENKILAVFAAISLAGSVISVLCVLPAFA